MEKKKIVIAQDIDQDLCLKVKDAIPDWQVVAGKDRTVWQNHLQDAEIIAGWKKGMEEACLKTESKLRWIQSWSAGIDSYPLDKLAAQNIHLTSANGVHAFPISETILGLMLALTRKIHTYVRNQTTKTWENANLNLEMHNKTIGIIGMGAIGKETAKIAKAFGMKVIGVRNSNRPEQHIDQMVTTEHLNAILPDCDYVVVTLPLTEDTNQLFGTEQFNRMKASSFFINIGRGEVVVEAALIKALQKKQIAGAGLDVFETEPLDAGSPLWELENVIITPHTAGATQHYDKRVIEDILIPNVMEYCREEKPSINLVDYTKGY